MIRILLPVFLLSIGVNLLAQRDLSRYSDQDLRLAALELFDQLATDPSPSLAPYFSSFENGAFRDDSPAVDLLADALVHGEVPLYKDTGPSTPVTAHLLADGLLRVYQLLSVGSDPVVRFEHDNPVSLAVFFVLADRLDGVLDGRLDAPDLTGYYDLWVKQAVPPAALCFDCRLDERWADRRGLINTKGLGELLPRRLRRQLAGNLPNAQKVAVLGRFVREQVVYSDESYNEDFWQTPFETLSSGSGDAEDLAVLFQAVAEHYGLGTKMVVGTLFLSGEQPRAVRNHAWVAYEGEVVDLTSFLGKHETAVYEPKMVLDSENSWFLTAGR
ncbi:transglutaminase domain-containing protein [Acanthopleuribacter pedis]|uniref:Transglutaminase domain-containing protein n=1 Tax=Acanthopleuribacter pedis TaxID=442870 RepID=A0A8J7QID5_9BACT|nr:transglutaminase domain-containing protein [Acanthopleuribacter pedis]MBO1318833.1 transglutaminase domain-containing protein [Acanthopleuribacter pedis]